ncbi:hypothetical protein [Kibdelosporangium aridum]|uniref:Uncharacterized protein n=1 Tax=Kibdelosporangium aridum TaxID=2030 RepID=A0A1Y5Y5R3_KIBAR|nr:hypothetical protein [Kibdelosporangium aridum]SMD25467.1 hypothetical protein SAMN05661093_09153 [Kibdelosporangium aridum]
MRELTYVARRTVEWREVPDPVVQSDALPERHLKPVFVRDQDR